MTLEHIFIFKGELPGFARVSMFGIIGNTKGNLAGWKIGEIILNWLIDELGSFN